jgi:peptide/nickel transport system permease protein
MLFGLATLVFFVSRLLPGDPARLHLAPGIPSNVAEELRTTFGLDQPLWSQYSSWLSSALHGQFGFSFSHASPVADVLLGVFPNTVILGLAALALECTIAFVLVLFCLWRINTRADRFISHASLVVSSLPSFWIGILLVSVLAFSWNIFPSSRMSTMETEAGLGMEKFGNLLYHLVLPACTAGIPGAAMLVRYLRSTVSDTLSDEHVLTATSMGLSRVQVACSYILPNALGPAVSFLGIEMGTLLAGVLVTETLFAWPGLGRVTVMAVFSRDYPLILGATILSGVVVIAANLLADVVRAVLDPRIRGT